MAKVGPWCGQPSDRGRPKNRTERLSENVDRVEREVGGVAEVGQAGR